MIALDISEVARRSGVAASALRYYEEKGLIASIGRRGLRRLFEPNVVQRLALIRLGGIAGFSLDEIGAMFSPEGGPILDRGAIAAKAGELDATIRRLTAMRDGLRHAAACPAPSHMECPKFRRILARAVTRPAARKRRGRPSPLAAAAAGRVRRLSRTSKRD